MTSHDPPLHHLGKRTPGSAAWWGGRIEGSRRGIAVASFEKQVERNLKGIQFEKGGQVDKAIKLYERNIEENFEGNHPYDRLAIIYRERNQIDDEIRVLEKAIWVFEKVVHKDRADRLPKLEKFKNRLEKARKLKEE